MKFLFISPRFSGGIGGHAAMLSDQLVQAGHEVTKMKTSHIPIKNLKNPSFAIFGTIQGLTNTKKYDIVHAFNVPSAFAMRYAKGRKKVLSIHGVFSDQVKKLHSGTVSSIASSTESRVLKWADALTTDSKISRNEYKKKLNFDFEYLPSAIDTVKLESIPNVEKISNQIIYLGRDSQEKGIDVLKNSESKINGKVVYCTNLSWVDAMKLLKSSDVLAVPSRMESLPTNIKEAFFLKIPVVATNVGGIPELVSHNKTGILVPSEDFTQLSVEINKILKNKENFNEIIENAHQFVIHEMSWEKILPKYLKFYEDLLNN
ncbi:glycosyltransferase family 4 protein [Nitrosopumilus sp.]|nr:glycosyltransferase family 4 protein [Nitrosopumilus sp.]|tara:strand:- start:5958 stop:6908 length:951 start_codon:yes stop_codon:yes gene_type:complete